jgi:hypothetical protein
MRTAFVTALVLSLIGIKAVQAQTASTATPAVEVAFSDETAQVRYRGNTNAIAQKDAEVFYTVFLSEDRNVVGSAGLLAGTSLDRGPLQIKLGPQAYAVLLSEKNNDVFALALGVEARYNLVSNGALAVVGSAFYSPDVLTFGEADNLKDLMARAEIGLGTRLIGFGGYRWFTLDQLDREEETLQSEMFIGVRWQLR